MEITLALLRARLAGTDFSRPSSCCALRRCLKSLILLLPRFYFLFASCLRQPGAHGLEFVTAFSPHDLLFVPIVQLPRTFPFELQAVFSGSQKKCLLCRETLQMEPYSFRGGKNIQR